MTNWLRGVKPHECGPTCGHGQLPPKPPPPVEDPLCADCDEPLSGHTSPILKDGVVIGLAHPENACRRFVPK